MKKSLFLLIVIVLSISFSAISQPGGSYDFLHKRLVSEDPSKNPLMVTELVLDNGLKVYLNEDHNLSKVFGAVVVNGGGKRDPEGHPGIAHYFEHIMFKGTDKIGTIDYNSEKIYLDSISGLYDELGNTTDEEMRSKIQKEINRVSLKAAEYAIPNEMDKVLEGMGGSGVNAFTSKDVIAYHNSFPGNQIDKWLEVYSHRFMKPVYRLFQSELETVYEERNMYMDNPFTKMIELFEANLYKGHPYANTVIGEADNLKNPSFTKMDQYFQTYYVANNMALILTGDFNTDEVIPVIKEKFGRWRSGDVPAMPDYKTEPLKGRQQISKRLTPVKIGLLGFQAIPNGHEDETALQVCNSILSNSSSTGLMDKLMMDNKLLAAFTQQMAYNEKGSIMIIYVPKLIGQSFSNAEGLVLDQLDKLKKGEFSDELFNSVKLEMEVQVLKSLESGYSRAFMLMDAFLLNKSWDKILSEVDKLKALTREDVIAVANKYYGENYLSFQSKTGFPKKEKLEKPAFEKVDPVNSEKESKYAAIIKAIPVRDQDPDFVDFGKDVQFEDLQGLLHFYYTPNPVNEIFNLRIRFGVGTEVIPELEVSDHLSLLGTDSLTIDKFNAKMQSLGSTFSISASDDYTTINISGLDDNFGRTISLVYEFLGTVKPDDSKLKQMQQGLKLNRKMELKDPGTEGEALKAFVEYGNKSSFLDRLSTKQIKAMKSAEIVDAFKKAQNYEVEIHYSGKLPYEDIKSFCGDKLLAVSPSVKSDSPVYVERNKVPENKVYFLNDKKAVQSQIHLIVEGEVNNREEREYASAFNKYYSQDMSSVIFQEIREFRSLAYSAYAYHSSPFYFDKKGYTFGFMSTQADKTIDALDIFTSLMKDMPRKPERVDDIRTSLIQSITTDKPGFRNMSNSVSYWLKKGYTEDPRQYSLNLYKDLNFDNIEEFYKKNIEGRPIAIIVVGDKKRVGFEDLKKFGHVTELKQKDVFTK